MEGILSFESVATDGRFLILAIREDRSMDCGTQFSRPRGETVQQGLLFADGMFVAESCNLVLVLFERERGQRRFLGQVVAAMRQPARALVVGKRFRPVARAVAEQQLIVFGIGEAEVTRAKLPGRCGT